MTDKPDAGRKRPTLARAALAPASPPWPARATLTPRTARDSFPGAGSAKREAGSLRWQRHGERLPWRSRSAGRRPCHQARDPSGRLVLPAPALRGVRLGVGRLVLQGGSGGRSRGGPAGLHAVVRVSNCRPRRWRKPSDGRGRRRKHGKHGRSPVGRKGIFRSRSNGLRFIGRHATQRPARTSYT